MGKHIPVRDRLERRRAGLSEHECWPWPGTLTGGYGRIQVDGSLAYVHRVSFEAFVGPIPDGLTIDHLCRNRSCFNPRHLDPVDQRVNNLRAYDTVTARNTRKVACPAGHPYSGSNLHVYRDPRGYVHRICRTCRDERNARTASA